MYWRSRIAFSGAVPQRRVHQHDIAVRTARAGEHCLRDFQIARLIATLKLVRRRAMHGEIFGKEQLGLRKAHIGSPGKKQLRDGGGGLAG